MYIPLGSSGLGSTRTHRRRRGMGDAYCPSIQQLQGIIDPTDPCQMGISAQNPSGNPAPPEVGQAAPAQTIFGVPVMAAIAGTIGIVALAAVFGGRK